MGKTMPKEIALPRGSAARLRLVAEGDAELMRLWKNENKQFFFHKQEITVEQQKAWFHAYLSRPDDHNYAVEERVGSTYETVGLLACRLLEDTVDVYNVMRGRRTEPPAVSMGEALHVFCAEIARHYSVPITCKVLKNNPAIGWYLRNGFAQRGDAPDHVVLGYDAKEVGTT
jgi:ribosomal protein S18 acetylase RimI-like enzyme